MNNFNGFMVLTFITVTFEVYYYFFFIVLSSEDKSKFFIMALKFKVNILLEKNYKKGKIISLNHLFNIADEISILSDLCF